jgi:hypothetical protein
LIPLSREPAVLAYHLGELTVSANPGMLRRLLFHRQASSGKDQVSGSARRKLKTRKSQSSTGGSQQPGYVALPKSKEALIRVPKRSRSEGISLVKKVNPPQRPRDCMRPGTYRKALIMDTNKRAI